MTDVEASLEVSVVCDVTLMEMERKTPRVLSLRCGLHCWQECSIWSPKRCALVFQGYPWPTSHQVGTWKYTDYVFWRASNYELIFKWTIVYPRQKQKQIIYRNMPSTSGQSVSNSKTELDKLKNTHICIYSGNTSVWPRTRKSNNQRNKTHKRHENMRCRPQTKHVL